MNQLINTTDYSPLVLILAALGAIGWIIAYFITIHNIRKHQYVEMPVFCACGNIAWEFLWGFIFYDRINMGLLYIWSYRVWFLIDIFIFISVMRYGYKQLDLPLLRRNAKVIFVGLTLACAAIITAFIKSELDNPMGSQTSYILNFLISATYIFNWLRFRKTQTYSNSVAWTKMLGTLMYSIFFFIRFPEVYAVTALSSAVFVLDVIYIWMIYNYKGEPEPGHANA
ncbi:MAG: hypothetical protein KGS48_13080 [Bacteroidetes bacterium]|nr:hypothetical protein [Bacteroidota bacterium]